MSLLKYIDRLNRMDDLIRRKATGTACEFASMLGISVSVLKENINEMRALGADVEFDRGSKSYCYRNGGRLLMKFEHDRLKEEQATNIKGGMSFFEYLLPYCITGR